MVQYTSPRLKTLKIKIGLVYKPKKNKEIYKKLVCYSDPRKEVDQEDNMDSYSSPRINLIRIKAGLI